MHKIAISTKNGGRPQAPYSQSIAYGNLLFISGQCPKEDGQIIYGSFEEQLRLTLNNLKAVLEAAGSCLENVLKVTVFLSDMDNFETMNQIYMGYFSATPPPARSCIEASRLPFDIMVEIDAIAYARKEE